MKTLIWFNETKDFTPEQWEKLKMATIPDNRNKQVQGIYKHYKGDLYRVYCIVKDCTNGSEKMMVLYEKYPNKTSELFTREENEFFGLVSQQGNMISRFKKISDNFSG